MTKAELIDEVTALILSGGRRTTAANVRILVTDIINSYQDIFTSEPGVTAYAAGGQVGATVITKNKTRVDNVPADHASVVLDAWATNNERLIRNAHTTNTLDIYPPIGNNIIDQADDTPFELGPGGQITFYCYEGDTGQFSII